MAGPRKPFPNTSSSETPPDASGPLDADMAENPGQNGALSGDESQLEVESVFSQRSGIRDPLLKACTLSNADSPGAPPEQRESGRIAVSGNKPPSRRIEPDDDDEDAIEPAQRGNRPPRDRDGHAKTLRVRRRKKKMQVFAQRLRFIVKLAMALVWVVMLWELGRSPLWKLGSENRFALENKHLITQEQLKPLIKPYVGQPLYLLDVGKLSRQIQARFPVVTHVAIRRQLFPARLNIILTEKRPWAEMYAALPQFISPPDEHAPTPITVPANPNGKLGPDGKPLADAKKDPLQAKTELPVAATVKPATPAKRPKPPRLVFEKPYGLIAENAFVPLKGLPYRAGLYPGRVIERVVLNPNTKYKTAYLQTLREFVWKARHLSDGKNTLYLRWVDARNPNAVNFHFQEANVILGSLDGTAEQRLIRLIALIPKIKEFEGAIDSVDLRWEEQVTLRTKPNALIVQPETEPRTDG